MLWQGLANLLDSVANLTVIDRRGQCHLRAGFTPGLARRKVWLRGLELIT